MMRVGKYDYVVLDDPLKGVEWYPPIPREPQKSPPAFYRDVPLALPRAKVEHVPTPEERRAKRAQRKAERQRRRAGRAGR